jgi:alkanesulfonate monooxygenase SsuD/methylene tetrahydromethanopterin reductase-like flavin-dependent oxidoreductase (luciferase family)
VLVPLHNPMHLAKEVATLQELFGGRFTLGVGMGWGTDTRSTSWASSSKAAAGEQTRRSG